MDLYCGGLDASRLPQSKYVIVLHSDLLSQVVHFGEPPFLFAQPFLRDLVKPRRLTPKLCVSVI